MMLRLLIQEWIAQLLYARERLRSSGPEPDAWHLHIRARILRFLVGRYRYVEEAPVRSAPSVGARMAKYRVPLPELIPEDRPPRQRSDLRPLLADIRRMNTRPPRRWRWW